MTGVHIYQIFYSEATRQSLDPGFIPLDNLQNSRPDWREYWPIRSFLLRNDLAPTDYYGFFSPRFGSKTGLDSKRVLEFVRANASSADVMLFSPFYDQIAVFANAVQQGCAQHRSAVDPLTACARLIAPEFEVDDALWSSMNTVFCNYFVANAAFWTVWLERCERIFQIAEDGSSDLGRQLNAGTSHDASEAPVKVFVLERVASMLLAGQVRFRVKAYNPIRTKFSPARVATHRLELVILDALKVAYAAQGYEQFREAFFHLRQNLTGMPEHPRYDA